MNQPAQQQNYGTAREASRLIDLARAGDPMDLELRGHAQDVLDDLRDIMRDMPELTTDLEKRIDHFTRKTGTAGMYLHLVVTNEKPDLQDYDPSQVVVYDGIQDGGINFSTADRRSTIYGDVMTSVNITDLVAYFRSGQKFVLVAHIGTHRDQDLNALETMLSALPALLEAAGMKPDQIAEILKALKSGNLPPAALKALHLAAEIGQLKLGNPRMTPQIMERIRQLGRKFSILMSNPATLRGLSPTLARAMASLRMVVRGISVSPSRPLGMAIRAQNDNQFQKAAARRLTFQSLQSGLLRTQRYLARNLKAIPLIPAIAMMLPSQAASSSAPMASTPSSSMTDYRAPAAVAVATTSVETSVQINSQPAVQQPVITTNNASYETAPAVVQPQAQVTEIQATTPQILNEQKVQEQPKPEIKPEPTPQAKEPPLPIIPVQDPVIKADPIKVISPAEPAVTPIIKESSPPVVTVQPDKEKANGRPLCCNEFGRVVKPDAIQNKSDVAAALGADVAARVTVKEAQEYLRSVQKADELMEKSGLEVVDTGDAKYKEETARLLAESNSHGDNCNCGNHFNGASNKKPDSVKEAEKKLETLSLVTAPKISAKDIKLDFS